MHEIGEGTVGLQVLSSFEVHHTIGVDADATMPGKEENDGEAGDRGEEVKEDFIYSRGPEHDRYVI